MNTMRSAPLLVAGLLALTSTACGDGSISVEGDTVTETRAVEAPDGTVLTAVVTYPASRLGDRAVEVVDRLVVGVPKPRGAERVHSSLRPEWMDLALKGPGADVYELTIAQPERPEVPDDRLERAVRPGPELPVAADVPPEA